MSMLQVSAIGRLTADVELKTSNNVNFVGFNVAVNTGYGDKAVTEYLQCILFDAAAEKFIKAGTKKGSHIWLTGKLQLRTFTKRDKTQDKCMNVQVIDWGYVPSSGNKEKTDGDATGKKREKELKQFDETSVGEDDDLPF